MQYRVESLMPARHLLAGELPSHCKRLRLVLENQGHDVLRFENRVKGYDAIAGSFVKHLRP